MTGKPELLGMLPAELEAFIGGMGLTAYRARQIYPLLMRGVRLEDMTALPAKARGELAAAANSAPPAVAGRYPSQRDGTVKLVFEMADGELVEGVLMEYKHGATLCLSTQAGCRMGCAFCASGLGGLSRNLTAGEMVGMAVAAHQELGGGADRRIGNIVLMGSGEPLDNFDNVVKFLRVINSPEGMGVGMRHISLSTCGLVDGIRRLIAEDLPVTLCVSLHAPDDELRKKIMPVANRWSLQELMGACREYIRRTGRRVIFEYSLIRGVNDGPERAAALAALLRGVQAHVNVIPLNDVPERELRGAGRAEAYAFQKALEEKGLSATVRREMGSDIEGACGQLRRRLKEDKAASRLSPG